MQQKKKSEKKFLWQFLIFPIGENTVVFLHLSLDILSLLSKTAYTKSPLDSFFMLKSLIARCLYSLVCDPLPAVTSMLVPYVVSKTTGLVLLLLDERLCYDVQGKNLSSSIYTVHQGKCFWSLFI